MINSSDGRGIKLFKQMEDDVSHYRFINILLESILIGLAFAIASVWSDVIISTSHHWLDDWALPLQDLIAAVVVTIFSIAAAALAVFILVIHPRQKLHKIRDDCHNNARVHHQHVQEEIEHSRNLFSSVPASRDI